MKRRIPSPTLCVSLALLAGCGDQEVTTPEPGAAPQFAAAARVTATVHTFADLTTVGTSRLVRNDNGVSVSLSTSRLAAGTAATLWIVVFNHPANCSPPGCGEDDLFAPAVMADVMYTNGKVIGGSGKATFSGLRREGDNGGSVFAALGLPAPGLIDSRMAEIHFVVRSHGPEIPGMVDEMIHTFNGGCQNPGPPFPDPLPPELGAPGPNTCMDVQFAMHLP
jgi:hypothetical protein